MDEEAKRHVDHDIGLEAIVFGYAYILGDSARPWSEIKSSETADHTERRPKFGKCRS